MVELWIERFQDLRSYFNFAIRDGHCEKPFEDFFDDGAFVAILNFLMPHFVHVVNHAKQQIAGSERRLQTHISVVVLEVSQNMTWNEKVNQESVTLRRFLEQMEEGYGRGGWKFQVSRALVLSILNWWDCHYFRHQRVFPAEILERQTPDSNIAIHFNLETEQFSMTSSLMLLSEGEFIFDKCHEQNRTLFKNT